MKFPSNVVLNFAYQGATYNALTPERALQEGVPEAAVFGAYKDLLKSRIDSMAESLRSSIATPGAGQAMEYQEAQSQAAAALKAQSSATPEKYPMLAASIGIDFDPTTNAAAADVIGVARAVTAAYQAWQAIGSEIRRARLTAKAAIDAASTVDEADAAAAAVAWPALAA